MTTRRRGNNLGFTLIEILMVVVILGIASAMIIPQLGTRDDLKVAAAARMLMADLTYAQNRAVAQQKKHYVRFYGQNYSVCDSSALVAIDHPLKPALHSGKYIAAFGSGALVQVSLGTVNFGSQTTLGFNDLGEPFAFDGITETPLTSTGAIIVQSGTHSLTIQIEPFTGDTSVQ